MKSAAKEFRVAFPVDPLLKPRPDLPLIRGRMQFELLNDFSVRFDRGFETVVPKGYITDGASIPKVAWSIIGSPISRPYLYPAIGHDFRYEVHGHINSLDYLVGIRVRELISNEANSPGTRKQIDLDFLEGLHKTSEAQWRIHSMYTAVRVGGGFAFSNKDKHQELMNHFLDE